LVVKKKGVRRVETPDGKGNQNAPSILKTCLLLLNEGGNAGRIKKKIGKIRP